MAESVPLLFDPKIISARYRNKPRRPQPKADVEENAHKRIIPKRPLRRPKLPDGTVLEPDLEPLIQPQREDINAKEQVELPGQYYMVRERIEETGKKFSMLNVDEDFPELSMAASSSSTNAKARINKKSKSLGKATLLDGSSLVISSKSSSFQPCEMQVADVDKDVLMNSFSFMLEPFDATSSVEGILTNTKENKKKKS